MGGVESGRFLPADKRLRLAEDCIVLDINQLIRQGLLEDGCTGRIWGHLAEEEENVRIYDGYLDTPQQPCKDPSASGKMFVIRHLKPSQEGYVVQNWQFVHLLTTRIHRGGARHWFRCPGPGPEVADTCGKRVGCLYLPEGSRQFLCRSCHGLTYRSRQRWNCRSPGALLPDEELKLGLAGRGRQVRDTADPMSIFEDVQESPRHAPPQPDEEAVAYRSLLFARLLEKGLKPGDPLFDQTMGVIEHLLRQRR
jgi:hypothetical protein